MITLIDKYEITAQTLPEGIRVFDTTIEKVIFGGYDKNGNPDSFMITFIFKKEFGSSDTIEGNLDYAVINEFSHLWKHYIFKPDGNNEKAKFQDNFIKVRIAISK